MCGEAGDRSDRSAQGPYSHVRHVALLLLVLLAAHNTGYIGVATYAASLTGGQNLIDLTAIRAASPCIQISSMSPRR